MLRDNSGLFVMGVGYQGPQLEPVNWVGLQGPSWGLSMKKDKNTVQWKKLRIH